MTQSQIRQHEEAVKYSGGVCAVCGKSLNGTAVQYAHKIANTTTNRKKYGSFIIDHPMNGAMVCSLSCNQSMNIGFDKGKCLSLIADILTFEMRRFVNATNKGM